MSDIQVRVIANRLSDGSFTFDVSISEGPGYCVLLHATSQDAANQLVALIRSGINTHTVDTAHILSNRFKEH